MCGEKSSSSSRLSCASGSPPRMRGKETSTIGIRLPAGITPACAGKSASHGFFVLLRWDHPRVCGEKQGNAAAISVTPGSPPRVRGKVVLVDFGPEFLGITPACAGKSRFPSSTAPYRRDHPRVCGEKAARLTGKEKPRGSPLRVRGKAVHHKHRHSPGRITPACAGKRAVRAPRRSSRWDHPRVCGEKERVAMMVRATMGSPPRMRRKDVRQELQHSGRGITPACAGKRTQYFPACSCIWEHPRVCGEKPAILTPWVKPPGSPPRVRGKVPSSI